MPSEKSHGAHGKLQVITDLEQQSLADDIQNRFADYRIRSASHVRGSHFDVPALGPDLRMLARILGSSIVDAPELQADLVSLMQEYQERSVAGNVFDEETITVEALLAHSHSQQPDQTVYVGQVTETANRLLRDRGSNEKLEARALGLIIRHSLFLSPKRRNSKGFGIRFTEDVCRRIQQLAREYNVPAPDENVPTCALCAELLTSNGEEGAGTKNEETAA